MFKEAVKVSVAALCYILGNSLAMYKWNKCPVMDQYRVIHSVSLNDCIRACKRHSDCEGISYSRTDHLCSLYNVIDTLSSCTGMLVIFRADFPSDIDDDCSGNCSISDCGRMPEVENAKIYGNRIEVGSRLKVECLYGGVVHYMTCKPNGQWSAAPTCQSDELIEVGMQCEDDSDCASINARCVDTQIPSRGRLCYCNRLYRYNQTTGTCTKECETYDVLRQYRGIYIKLHNIGDSDGAILTMAQCLQFCQTNFPTFQSFDHVPDKIFTWRTNCYCNDVTYQQMMEANPGYIYQDEFYYLYSWTCNNTG